MESIATLCELRKKQQWQQRLCWMSGRAKTILDETAVLIRVKGFSSANCESSPTYFWLAPPGGAKIRSNFLISKLNYVGHMIAALLFSHSASLPSPDIYYFSLFLLFPRLMPTPIRANLSATLDYLSLPARSLVLFFALQAPVLFLAYCSYNAISVYSTIACHLSDDRDI